MSQVAGYQTRNWFITGRVEESTADYFALIKRNEEAKEGYEEALAAYDRVLPSDLDFAAAQQQKKRVGKKLEPLVAYGEVLPSDPVLPEAQKPKKRVRKKPKPKKPKKVSSASVPTRKTV